MFLTNRKSLKFAGKINPALLSAGGGLRASENNIAGIQEAKTENSYPSASRPFSVVSPLLSAE